VRVGSSGKKQTHMRRFLFNRFFFFTDNSEKVSKTDETFLLSLQPPSAATVRDFLQLSWDGFVSPSHLVFVAWRRKKRTQESENDFQSVWRFERDYEGTTWGKRLFVAVQPFIGQVTIYGHFADVDFLPKNNIIFQSNSILVSSNSTVVLTFWVSKYFNECPIKV